ncbi:MAG: cytochrome P460 family protein [Verrucomicrobia bacterium]|nr:cytochrome P460 family protein [Verrucomicrobiota bacterium]
MKSNPIPARLRIIALTACCFWLASPLLLRGAEPEKSTPPAPTKDRVGFPKHYQEKFQVLRTVNKEKEQKVVTVYGNGLVAAITNSSQLPYPNGSVIVMETASTLSDAQGKPLLDERGNLRKDKVLGLHVMRREKNFGEAYGENRTGEWEYVEYRADGSHLTPPQESASCAECHVKAGAKRDFVYRGRFPANADK